MPWAMGRPSLCPTSLSSPRAWVDDQEAGRKGESHLTQSGQRKAIRSKRPEAKPEVLLRGLQSRSSAQFRGAGEGQRAEGQGGLLKGRRVYRKGMEWEEPGSAPPLTNLCDLGHRILPTSLSPSEEWGGWIYLQACSLEICNRVVVRHGALVPGAWV